MKTVYLLIGLPGSGKTTWSRNLIKNPNYAGEKLVIVNRDMFRKMINGEYLWCLDKEPLIRRMALACAQEVLLDEYDLIMDEVNLKKSIRFAWLADIDLIDNPLYDVSYVWFKESEKNLDQRMTNARGYSRDYWGEVIDGMKKNFEDPTYDEPFNKLYVVENRETKLIYLKCRCGFQGESDKFGEWTVDKHRFCPECEAII